MIKLLNIYVKNLDFVDLGKCSRHDNFCYFLCYHVKEKSDS